MQVNAVATKIAALFNECDINVIVNNNRKYIVCYANDYNRAATAIKRIADRVYMTVDQNVVACYVDGIEVAITNGKPDISDAQISVYVKASLTREIKFPEYSGEQSLVKAVQKDIAERFVQCYIASSLEHMDNGKRRFVICRVKNIDAAYRAVADVASSFVYAKHDRMIAGFVKGVCVGILEATPTSFALSKEACGDFIMDAISKRGEYKKYNSTAA